MIIHTKGKVEYIDFDGQIFLQVNNSLSYQIEYLKEVTLDQEIDVWGYLVMKESEGKIDIKVYGFDSRAIIADFERIISISGVGPKMAYAILKNIERNKFIELIKTSDVAALKKVPGVGDKIAKRIILELSRLYSADDDALSKIQKETLTDDQNEIIETLYKMGFDKKSVIDGLKKVDSSRSKGDQLKEVLKFITQNA